VLAEAAGSTAGSWYAWPATHVGYEIVAAEMLIMAGGHDGKPLNFDELERFTRLGYERGMRFRKGERRVDRDAVRRLLAGKVESPGLR
jgi:hypothetical protein